jgi:hypothetical protein
MPELTETCVSVQNGRDLKATLVMPAGGAVDETAGGTP